jgi:hypothetical protein
MKWYTMNWLPAISTALVMHAGHTGFSSLAMQRSRYGLLSAALGVPANAFVYRGPASVHPGLLILGDEAERGVPEGDQGSAVGFTQPVLHVGNERERGEQWTGEFKQRGPLDGLDVGVRAGSLTMQPIQQDYFRPAGQRTELKGSGWHSFRHSYRSMLDAAGAPIGVQQKLMRHAQVTRPGTCAATGSWQGSPKLMREWFSWSLQPQGGRPPL